MKMNVDEMHGEEIKLKCFMHKLLLTMRISPEGLLPFSFADRSLSFFGFRVFELVLGDTLALRFSSSVCFFPLGFTASSSSQDDCFFVRLLWRTSTVGESVFFWRKLRCSGASTLAGFVSTAFEVLLARRDTFFGLIAASSSAMCLRTSSRESFTETRRARIFAVVADETLFGFGFFAGTSLSC